MKFLAVSVVSFCAFIFLVITFDAYVEKTENERLQKEARIELEVKS